MSSGRRRKRTVNCFSEEQMRLLQNELESKDLKQEAYEIKGFKTLFKNWSEKDLCCVVKLRSGSKSFRVHKKTLAKLSDYFKGLFRFSDKLQHELDESLIKDDILELIIWYAYSGKVDVTNEIAQDLFIAANYLQIDDIQTKCEDFMAKHLSRETFLELVPFANKFGADHLMDSICSYISANFQSVLKDTDLLKLCPSDLTKILQNRNLSAFEGGIPVVNPEVDILRLVGHYVSGQEEKLEDSCISDLICQIRFEEFTNSNELRQVLDAFPCLDCVKIQDVIRNSDKEDMHVETQPSLRRSFSNLNKYFKEGPQYANDWPFSADPSFEHVDISDRIQILRIFVGKTHAGWIMIGAIWIQYHSGQIVKFGTKIDPKLSLLSEHKFILKQNEVITRISLQSSGLSRILVDIRFDTNCGRHFGPFGKRFLIEAVDKGTGKRNYFHSMAAKVFPLDYTDFDGLSFVKFRRVAFSSKSRVITDDHQQEDEK